MIRFDLEQWTEKARLEEGLPEEVELLGLGCWLWVWEVWGWVAGGLGEGGVQGTAEFWQDSWVDTSARLREQEQEQQPFGLC